MLGKILQRALLLLLETCIVKVIVVDMVNKIIGEIAIEAEDDK